MSIDICALQAQYIPLLEQHFQRHRAESGRGEHHFMPYDPEDPVGPRGLEAEALARGLSEPGWQRWFVVLDGESRVVGHADLKAGSLASSLHRCELGIGIEREWRGGGLGRQLMLAAIGFAREQQSLDWVDLRAFAHNAPALALYRGLGFVEQGIRRDLFRIGDTSIDDVIMALDVRGEAAASETQIAADQAPGLNVRPYREADEAAVIALWQACGLVVPWNDPTRDIARKLKVGRDLFLVSCDESGVVATVMGGYEGHRGWVNYLAVNPARQREGLGQRMMAEIEQRLDDRGCPKINLQVRSGNTEVVAFYESIGYRLDDVLGLGKRLQPDQ